MKTIIIDGNNLMHKIYGNADNQLAIIERVKTFVGKKDKVIFYFDGVGESNRSDVIFSGKKKADDLMREFIEKFKNHKMLKVVSSDREISGLAKVCGCEVQSSEEFYKEMNKKNVMKGKNVNQRFIYDEKGEKPSSVSRKSLDEFRKLFG
ncbi:MAG TPA: NYN domain-containing protein [Ignavibacteria bacterium]|nr:NYN domain-containing protein [Ignavibacteria bacterium]